MKLLEAHIVKHLLNDEVVYKAKEASEFIAAQQQQIKELKEWNEVANKTIDGYIPEIENRNKSLEAEIKELKEIIKFYVPKWLQSIVRIKQALK